MNEAEARRSRKRVAEYVGTVRLSQVHVGGVKGLGELKADLDSGITVLVGLNGSGKSSFLKGISYACSASEWGASAADAGNMLEAVSVSANIRGVTSSWMRLASGEYTSPLPDGLKVEFCDPAGAAHRLRERLLRDADIDSLLNGIEPTRLSDQRNAEISHLLGRRIKSCSVYEIDIGVEEEWPYFIVESERGTYRAEEMGQGELSLFVLLWFLGRLERESLVLIEEPEAQLSPRCQRRLADFLWNSIYKQSCCAVVATHSGAFIRHLPMRCLRIFALGPDGHSVMQPSGISDCAQVLGVERYTSLVTIVEDWLAGQLLAALVHRFAPDLSKECETVIAADGASGVRRLRELPRLDRGPAFVAVLDGDQPEEDSGVLPVPCYSLPGGVAPEDWLRVYIGKNLKAVGDGIGVRHDTMLAAWGAADGLDLHDWMHEFADVAAVSIAKLVDGAVRVIQLSDEDIAHINELMGRLREAPIVRE